MGANAVAAEDGTGVGLVGDGMVCMERRGRGLKREQRYPRLFSVRAHWSGRPVFQKFSSKEMT